MLAIKANRGDTALQHPAKARHYIEFVLALRPAGTHEQAIQRSSALLELAAIEDASGTGDQASEHLQEALTIALQHNGGINQSVIAIRGFLAYLSMKRGEMAAAEQQFRAMLAMAEHYVESHINVRATMVNLASVLNVQHKYEEAEALLRRSIELSRKYAGDNREVEFNSLNNLTLLLAETGRLAEAGPIRERLRTDVIELRGADHPFAIMLTLNLAEQRVLENNGAAAQPLAMEAIERGERILGTDHVYSIEGHELLARARFLQGERSTAIADMAKVCARKRKILGEAQQHTLTCMSHRADMLAATGQRDEAVAVMKQVLTLTEHQLGADNPGTIDARAHLQTISNESPG